MSGASPALAERIAARLSATVDPAVADFARALADAAGARAVLFYGSNLRTGSLEGVLDFYVLLPGTEEPAIWPTVSLLICAVVNAATCTELSTAACPVVNATT